jgi:predicted AAA+ superfamily ATPase
LAEPNSYHRPVLPGRNYPRLAAGPLAEALEDSPVVLIHGPRQCGKTTLARAVCEPRGYRYITFDDDVARLAATDDPAGFVDGLPARVVLDEVQHVPALFGALKRAVDRDRAPGRFVLTGSTNVLLLPTLADSLAGRMEIIRLHPLAQLELLRKPPAFLGRLFGGGFPTAQRPRLGPQLADRIVAGGYPAALARSSQARRSRWYRDYVQAIVERDVRDLSRIHALRSLPQLMSLAASQTAHLLNVTELAAPFQLSRQTIRDHVTLLERVFLVEEIPPWHSNRLGRLVKTPKLHFGDTGLAATLLGVEAEGLWTDRALLGQLLETFMLQELQRQATGHPHPLRFHHFRDKDGAEVDIVIEQGPRAIAGVEVKASATVNESDLRGLRKLGRAAGMAFRRGVVLYDGETSASLGEHLVAVPIRSLWEDG